MKKIKFFLSAFVLFFLLYPMSAKAEASKQINVELTKEYVSAVFNISTTEFDLRECTISIINPEGREYIVEKAEKENASISINNVTPGNWKILFHSETLAEFGKADVKVEGLKEAVANADEEIVIAANISGLKLYLKDDSLVVEWNDSSCGAVQIKVMDSKTLQVLDNTTVGAEEKCYYEYPIPSEIQELLVTVVPSTSASIVGAENAYTIKVYNHPKASITYEDTKATNQDSYSFHAKLEDRYKLLLMANNKKVKETEFLTPGEYDMTLPVKDGINQYIVYVVSENGNMKSFPSSVTGDFIAPQLTVENSSQSFIVNEDTYSIKGTVFDHTALSVNEKPVQNIYDDGVFEYEYLLHEGDNNITVRAIDEAGNTSSATLNLHYEIPKKLPIGRIIGVILCIILIAFLIRTCRKIVQERDKKEKGEGEQHKTSKHPAKKIQRKSNKTNASPPKKILLKEMAKWNWIVTPALIIVTYYILTHFLIAQIIISSPSMEPTLMTGDLVFFNRLAYVKNEVERGDIVCFWSEEENSYMGKRVLGLPGDEISFIDGYLCINGDFMDESSYIVNDLETNCEKSFVVPKDSYFMLGDNREISKDSRYFENPYIEKSAIIGKYMGSSGININFFQKEK